MADTFRDRYQRAMSVPHEDAAMKLARIMGTKPQGSSPLLGPQAMPAYQIPFAGLRNDAQLPAFEQPGGSLPIENYMAAPGSQQQPPMTAPPPQMQAAMPPPPPEVMPMTTEPVPQIGDPQIAALVQAMAKKPVAPWAVNEGNFMDQYG